MPSNGKPALPKQPSLRPLLFSLVFLARALFSLLAFVGVLQLLLPRIDSRSTLTGLGWMVGFIFFLAVGVWALTGFLLEGAAAAVRRAQPSAGNRKIRRY